MTWGAAQAETDHSNLPFFTGSAVCRTGQTIAQDAARAAVLAPNTIMAQIASSRKWVPLTDVDPAATAGKMKCGAFGSTAKAMKAITDGSFKVQIDGETALSLTGLNFSEIASVGDTGAKAVCGALGTTTLGDWQAVTGGGFKITIDGTEIGFTALNFSGIAALDEIPDVINYAAAGRFTCVYDAKTDIITFLSPTRGTPSTISVLAAPASGTDISGAGFLNGLSATLTQGTGSDGTGLTMVDVINANATFISSGARCEWDGSAFTIVSPTLGVNSAVSVLTAGASGTDISGASYLNGLSGTGTATAGTGLDGSHLPLGIYRGANILAATLVAGDVTGNDIIVRIDGGTFNETNVVLENSLTMNTVIPAVGMTIRSYLEGRGLCPKTTVAADANA